MDNEKFVKEVNKLIVRVAQGNSRALESLFDLTKKPLFLVAKGYLTDKSKAEDVLSETYLKVVKGAKYFDNKKNGYNWLYEITKNTALNENRKEKVKPLENNESVYDCFDDLIDGIAVKSAMAELPPEDRRIIYEYFFEKKTIREIADGLRKSKSSTHERIMKILQNLKKFLN